MAQAAECAGLDGPHREAPVAGCRHLPAVVQQGAFPAFSPVAQPVPWMLFPLPFSPARPHGRRVPGKRPRSRPSAPRRPDGQGALIPADPKLDWAGNYAHQMGYPAESVKELMRLYTTIHADHEGGNVSAHATHLVGLPGVAGGRGGGVSARMGPSAGLPAAEAPPLAWVGRSPEPLPGALPRGRLALPSATHT